MLLSAKPLSQPLDHPLRVESQAPAKLILTGEHAVLHQQAAISLPIPLYSHCLLQLTPPAQEPLSNRLQIELIDLQQTASFCWQEVTERCAQLINQYQAFLAERLSIKSVLESPFDLILLGIYHFSEHAPLPLAEMQIQIHSAIPMERGLGSSASIIVSLIKALEKATNTQLSSEDRLTLAQQIENYQHGRSSGVDTATIALQQSLFYQQGQWQAVDLGAIPQPLQAWLIDSGKAYSSTGDVVAAVAQNFTGSPIWHDFAHTTTHIQTAWQTQQTQTLLEGIQRNQALLVQIGVVPTSVDTLCQQLVKELGGAAKVCGAGSLDWQIQHATKDAPSTNIQLGAGIVLYLGEQSPKQFCQKHHLTYYPIEL